MKATAVKIMAPGARPLCTAQLPSATVRNRSHESNAKYMNISEHMPYLFQTTSLILKNKRREIYQFTLLSAFIFNRRLEP
jgi:hypothetical protein